MLLLISLSMLMSRTGSARNNDLAMHGMLCCVAIANLQLCDLKLDMYYDSSIPLASILGFNNKPTWVTLKQDTLSYRYAEDELPGEMLLKLDFGKLSESPDIRPKLDKLEMRKFELRAHLFQVRDVCGS